MSNPDYVGNEGETFTDDELEDNFQDYLDNDMPEFTFGNLSYSAGRVLREIDYTAFREEFNNWVDAADDLDEWHEGHPWLAEDEDDDECTVWGKAPNGAAVICTLEGEHTTHIAQAYDMHKVYEINGVVWE